MYGYEFQLQRQRSQKLEAEAAAYRAAHQHNTARRSTFRRMLMSLSTLTMRLMGKAKPAPSLATA